MGQGNSHIILLMHGIYLSRCEINDFLIFGCEMSIQKVYLCTLSCCFKGAVTDADFGKTLRERVANYNKPDNQSSSNIKKKSSKILISFWS